MEIILSHEQANMSTSHSVDENPKTLHKIKCTEFSSAEKIASLPKSNCQIDTKLCSQVMNQKRSKPKRPDMKLYVPRARRSQCPSEITTTKETYSMEEIENCGKTKKILEKNPTNSSSKSIIRKQQENCDKEKCSLVQDCNQMKNVEFDDKNLTINENIFNNDDKKSNENSDEISNAYEALNELLTVQKLIDEISTQDKTVISNNFCENKSLLNISSLNDTIRVKVDENISDDKELEDKSTEEHCFTSDFGISSNVSPKSNVNNENRSHQETVQFISNELYESIADENVSSQLVKEEKQMNDLKEENILIKLEDCAETELVCEEKVENSNNRINIAECKQENIDDSWDAMFDDSGECLNPDILKELTTTVGDVKINKSKYNYLEFQPHEPDVSGEEYGHIVEFYDFPVDFKTQDLMAIFSTFKNQGFNIKWVDDTHALGVFSSPLAAKDALNLKHPLLKVRPLSQGIRESKFKAKRCAEFLQPYRPRPETSASLARRLVSGALGVKLHVPKEQRELERQRLKEARDRRRQAAKQKQDIWDGVVS